MDKNPYGINEGHKAERKLASNWRLIEKYQATSYQSSGNYSDNTDDVYVVSSLADLAMLWKNTSYSQPSSLFFDFQNQKIRSIELEGENKMVDGLLLFKDDIKPKWEDPANAAGSSFVIEFSAPSKQEMDTIWESLVFAMLGNCFPHSECVNGLRMLDRLKKHKVIKFEIWVSIGLKKWKNDKETVEENSKKIDTIIEHFHKIINEVIKVSIHFISTNDHFVSLR
jgi:hypothetical protein